MTSADVSGTTVLRPAGMAILVALVLAAITFFIADAISGPLTLEPSGDAAAEEVTIGATVVAAIVGSLLGVGLALLSRLATRPQTVFLTICVVGLVGSGIMLFGQAEQASTAVWLNLMHLAVAVPVVGSLWRWLPATKAN